MKAISRRRYGPPEILGLEELPTPEPAADEVVIRVAASSVNASDRHLLRGHPLLARVASGGLLRPELRVLGSDVAGVVEAVGSGVDSFGPGDEVFGDLSGVGFGAFAEYVSVPGRALAPMPAGASFEAAAALASAGTAALQGLRDRGRIRAGQRVLVNGASGGVGTFAVQIARSFGAEVTGVCSGAKMDMVRSIGADHVIDYGREDVTQAGGCYDLILDLAARRPVRVYRRALAPGGTYVFVGGSFAQMLQATLLGPLLSMATDRRLTVLLASASREDLIVLKELVESGEIAPVIDERRFTLEQVPDAIRHVEGGRALGKVAVTV